MTKPQNYLTLFFDLIVANYNNYWKFTKENYGVIVVFLSIIGGLNQILNLLFISPSIIVYYSPQQGILDGVLFLTFIVLTFAIFIILSIWFYQIGRSNPWYKNYILVTAYLLIVLIPFIGIIKNLSLLGLYFGFGLLLTISLIHHGEQSRDKIFQIEKHQNYAYLTSKKREENRLIFEFTLILLIISFFVFFVTMRNVIVRSNDIYNIEVVQRKLNLEYSANYKALYNNGEYIFFKDDRTGKCIVLDSETITKIILNK